MQRRTLGKTGYQISEMGLGTWAIGGSWGQVVDRDRALHGLAYAADQGVNFFDTADVYGDGRAEELLGAIFHQRPDILIATKFCRRGDIQDSATYRYDTVKRYLTDSLRRLQRDAVDLYQIHCPPTWVIEQGDVFDVLDRLQDEGLVRHYGVSVETIHEGLIAMNYPRVASLQVIFNVLRQKPVADLFPKASAKNVGILARVPLASGLLTGKFRPTDTFPDADHRNFNQNGEAFNVGETFSGLPFQKGVELVDDIRWMATGRGTLAAAALRWILDQPAVTSVIPGFKNIDQVQQNLAAADAPSFSTEELDRLSAFYRRSVEPWIRGPY
ncbi:aldo/keto reductase [Sulfobacillus harzensis]|uniref:Aldo/keto reductase n=1 Tax=Sulfobacillus harzensis TaxID=2729629 RepID=A0A7Y0L3V2_9FIRM|nr:aldo/keto reductase [Sulfobacillus harzensis]NMP21414.1 aldo/keto reductase [Sulfobacillus harzensis]